MTSPPGDQRLADSVAFTLQRCAAAFVAQYATAPALAITWLAVEVAHGLEQDGLSPDGDGVGRRIARGIADEAIGRYLHLRARHGWNEGRAMEVAVAQVARDVAADGTTAIRWAHRTGPNEE